jgi:hypothetical protein
MTMARRKTIDGVEALAGHTAGRLVVRLSHRLRHGRYRITVTTGHGRHAHSLTRTVRVR